MHCQEIESPEVSLSKMERRTEYTPEHCAFITWKHILEKYLAADKEQQFSRINLLMQPLAALDSMSPDVCTIKFKIWWDIFVGIDLYVEALFLDRLYDFLHFCFGTDNNHPLHTHYSSFTLLQDCCINIDDLSDVLAQILELNFASERTQYNMRQLERPILSKPESFLRLANSLIFCVGKCTILMTQKTTNIFQRNFYLYTMWRNLLQHIIRIERISPTTKKNVKSDDRISTKVEVMKYLFCILLRLCEISEEKENIVHVCLSPVLETTLSLRNGLPDEVLTNKLYFIGQFRKRATTPLFTMLDILFSPVFLKVDLQNEALYVALLTRILDLGIGPRTSTIYFVNEVMRKLHFIVTHNALKKYVLRPIWETLAKRLTLEYVVLGHNVNQGTVKKVNFGWFYEVLMFPIVNSAPFKYRQTTTVRIWSQLFQAFQENVFSGPFSLKGNELCDALCGHMVEELMKMKTMTDEDILFFMSFAISSVQKIPFNTMNELFKDPLFIYGNICHFDLCILLHQTLMSKIKMLKEVSDMYLEILTMCAKTVVIFCKKLQACLPLYILEFLIEYIEFLLSVESMGHLLAFRSFSTTMTDLWESFLNNIIKTTCHANASYQSNIIEMLLPLFKYSFLFPVHDLHKISTEYIISEKLGINLQIANDCILCQTLSIYYPENVFSELPHQETLQQQDNNKSKPSIVEETYEIIPTEKEKNGNTEMNVEIHEEEILAETLPEDSQLLFKELNEICTPETTQKQTKSNKEDDFGDTSDKESDTLHTIKYCLSPESTVDVYDGSVETLLQQNKTLIHSPLAFGALPGENPEEEVDSCCVPANSANKCKCSSLFKVPIKQIQYDNEVVEEVRKLMYLTALEYTGFHLTMLQSFSLRNYLKVQDIDIINTFDEMDWQNNSRKHQSQFGDNVMVKFHNSKEQYTSLSQFPFNINWWIESMSNLVIGIPFACSNSMGIKDCKQVLIKFKTNYYKILFQHAMSEISIASNYDVSQNCSQMANVYNNKDNCIYLQHQDIGQIIKIILMYLSPRLLYGRETIAKGSIIPSRYFTVDSTTVDILQGVLNSCSTPLFQSLDVVKPHVSNSLDALVKINDVTLKDHPINVCEDSVAKENFTSFNVNDKCKSTAVKCQTSVGVSKYKLQRWNMENVCGSACFKSQIKYKKMKKSKNTCRLPHNIQDSISLAKKLYFVKRHHMLKRHKRILTKRIKRFDNTRMASVLLEAQKRENFVTSIQPYNLEENTSNILVRAVYWSGPSSTDDDPINTTNKNSVDSNSESQILLRKCYSDLETKDIAGEIITHIGRHVKDSQKTTDVEESFLLGSQSKKRKYNEICTKECNVKLLKLDLKKGCVIPGEEVSYFIKKVTSSCSFKVLSIKKPSVRLSAKKMQIGDNIFPSCGTKKQNFDASAPLPKLFENKKEVSDCNMPSEKSIRQSLNMSKSHVSVSQLSSTAQQKVNDWKYNLPVKKSKWKKHMSNDDEIPAKSNLKRKLSKPVQSTFLCDNCGASTRTSQCALCVVDWVHVTYFYFKC